MTIPSDSSLAKPITCAPSSLMEHALASRVFNAMCGYGGLIARASKGGLGDLADTVDA